MRRIALLGLALALSGCGYKTWWNPPFSPGYNPNQPVGDSENLLRVQGLDPVVPPLTTEPGDIWPGPLPPAPTMKDLVNQEGAGAPEQPVPGSPLRRGTIPAVSLAEPQSGKFDPAGERLAWPAAAAVSAAIVELRGASGRSAGEESERAGDPDAGWPGSDDGGWTGLSDDDHAGRRPGDRGAERQWHEHGHPLGRTD